MKTYFISWEIRFENGDIAFSNTVYETDFDTESLTAKQVYLKNLKEVSEHYEVNEKSVTARTFNEV